MSSEPTKAPGKPTEAPASSPGNMDPKPKAKPLKGYSNPALKAMGINRIWLPSRNWMIFFAVTGALVGGAYYDRREQKKIRKKYMEMAAPYGERLLETNETPRKVSVYMSPPPDEYLEKSYTTFKRFVKPILNAGGLDAEIFYSNQQGKIRHHVASSIRDVRRGIHLLEEKKKKTPPSPTKLWFGGLFSSQETKERVKRELEEQKTAQFLESMANQKSLLSIYYADKDKEHKPETHSKDSEIEDVHKTGGVICIGRGSYKEYLLGLHEGLLGPLHKPERVIEAQAEDQHKILTQIREQKLQRKKKDEPEPAEVEDIEVLKEKIRARGELDDGKPASIELDEEYKDDQYIEPEVVRLYLIPEEYKNGVFSPELAKYYPQDGDVKKIPTPDGVAPFFQQSISVIETPNLLGFANIPRRIWRFYNRRYLAEEYGKLTMEVLRNQPRSFIQGRDEDLGAREEEDWPRKWVQRAKDNGRDWATELRSDERVVSKIRVYNEVPEEKHEEH